MSIAYSSRLSLFIIVSVAFVACMSDKKDLRQKFSDGVRTQGARREFVDALSTISDPTSSKNKVNEALEVVDLTKEPLERPQFWIGIANSPRYNDYARSMAFVQFFRRHVKLGDSIGNIGTLEGTRDWFTEESIIPATAFSQLPFELKPGATAWVICPPFLTKLPNRVVLNLSREGFYYWQLGNIVRAGNTNSDIRVLAVSAEWRSLKIPEPEKP